jgi:hypothetical protein
MKLVHINKSSHRLMVTQDKFTYGNELHQSGCTCGYTGTGPHGTVEVLDKAGFQVGRRYIFTAIAFGINHPETELELYGERL